MQSRSADARRTIADHNTGETITFEKTAAETGGEKVVMRLELAPGTVVSPHAHPIVETFELLEGEVELTVDGQVVELGAGKVVTVQSGHIHGFKNSSAGAAALRLVATPGAEAEFGLRVKFQLSRDGYIPVPGGPRPKDPLLGALVIHRGGLYFPPLPRPLLRLLMASLAMIARARGKERFLLESYPDDRRYLEALEVAAPEHSRSARTS